MNHWTIPILRILIIPCLYIRLYFFVDQYVRSMATLMSLAPIVPRYIWQSFYNAPQQDHEPGARTASVQKKKACPTRGWFRTIAIRVNKHSPANRIIRLCLCSQQLTTSAIRPLFLKASRSSNECRLYCYLLPVRDRWSSLHCVHITTASEDRNSNRRAMYLDELIVYSQLVK